MADEIAVISGKGGTGKTTIAAAFIAIAKNLVLADCDVDAPDLHILLQPIVDTIDEFHGSKVAVIDENACTLCGLCRDRCRFDAVHLPQINTIACEGCGVCAHVCPEEAIDMVDRISGMLYKSHTRFGPMSHAKLLPGEGNSGKLVTEVRKNSQELARRNGSDIILIDGSPGIGCPVIATVTGIKLGIIVTEPTKSGIHDMERVLSLLQRFNIPAMVIINKYDINLINSQRIHEYCMKHSVDVLGRIPFDSIMTDSMVAATTLPEYVPNHELTTSLSGMWSIVMKKLSD
ncbi:MAG: ATP-binding protein [Candidatus Hodarchaeota archaeon]